MIMNKKVNTKMDLKMDKFLLKNKATNLNSFMNREIK